MLNKLSDLSPEQQERLRSLVAQMDEENESLEEGKEKAKEELPEGDQRDEIIADLQKRQEENTQTITKLMDFLNQPDFSGIDTGDAEDELDELSLKSPFQGIGHMAYDVWKAGKDGRNASPELRQWENTVREKATMTVGDAEEGGYLIPPADANRLFERVRTENDIYSNALIMPMAAPRLSVSYINSFDESQGVVDGNIAWYWVSEEGQGTQTNIETGRIQLNLHKCMGLAKVTGELMKWSPQSIQSMVERSFTRGLNLVINKMALRGTGAGQPKGVITATPPTIEVPKADGQAADTVILTNITDMVERLYSANETIGNATWYFNRGCFGQIAKLSLAVGTGGAAVFLGGGQVQARPDLNLFGMPLRFSRYMSALGDAADSGLFDWTQYIIGVPTGGPEIETAVSIHLYFDYDANCFRFVTYIEGQPWWPDEFTPLYGDTQSPFMTLAERT